MSQVSLFSSLKIYHHTFTVYGGIKKTQLTLLVKKKCMYNLHYSDKERQQFFHV